MSIVIGRNIIELDTVDSTNNYAQQMLQNKKLEDGTVIIAHKQLSGKGQQGNLWESKEGENLTFSIILYPDFIPPEEQFYLSKAISLGVVDYLKTEIDNVRIKWPNDIYVDDRKIAGILIENSITRNLISNSIIGIGLNVNQSVFPAHLPNPTSMKLKAAKHFNINSVLKLLLTFIENRYLQLAIDRIKPLNADYLSNLYRFNEFQLYKANDEQFEAKIVDIEDYGRLVLVNRNGEFSSYDFKEISFVM